VKPETARADERFVVSLLQSGLLGIGAVVLAVVVVAAGAAVIVAVVALSF
jgi:hypothetical protein